MKAAEFDALLERRIGLMRQVLASKGKEYASDQDWLHNFKRAAEIRGSAEEIQEDTPAGVLLGMLIKHWVSIEDLVLSHTLNGGHAEPARIDAKIGDAINYLILLEAVLKE